ncbi:MAG TPA: hypothetical protein VGQ20_12740 [Acidimicrobiales bacterium]|jgi:hypothetical protein|nr:hypothetical protein [Acidimicrobiales bacterium]
MSGTFVQLIDEALAGVNGEVLDKSRVIDRLLDLRIAADSPELASAVDETLRNVPGRTMVPTAWLTEALSELRLAAELEGEKTIAH